MYATAFPGLVPEQRRTNQVDSIVVLDFFKKAIPGFWGEEGQKPHTLDLRGRYPSPWRLEWQECMRQGNGEGSSAEKQFLKMA